MGLIGTSAPEFSLDSTAGRPVSLVDTIESGPQDGPVIVVLFRGPWCSFCAEQLRSYSAIVDRLRTEYDTSVLPVTGASVPALREMQTRYQLRVELLSDPSLDVARTYTGIEDNDAYGAVPIPGTFIVDSSGKVRYEHVAERPDDRTFANFARYFIQNDFEDPYPGTYPDPY